MSTLVHNLSLMLKVGSPKGAPGNAQFCHYLERGQASSRVREGLAWRRNTCSNNNVAGHPATNSINNNSATEVILFTSTGAKNNAAVSGSPPHLANIAGTTNDGKKDLPLSEAAAAKL